MFSFVPNRRPPPRPFQHKVSRDTNSFCIDENQKNLKKKTQNI